MSFLSKQTFCHQFFVISSSLPGRRRHHRYPIIFTIVPFESDRNDIQVEGSDRRHFFPRLELLERLEVARRFLEEFRQGPSRVCRDEAVGRCGNCTDVNNNNNNVNNDNNKVNNNYDVDVALSIGDS